MLQVLLNLLRGAKIFGGTSFSREDKVDYTVIKQACPLESLFTETSQGFRFRDGEFYPGQPRVPRADDLR